MKASWKRTGVGALLLLVIALANLLGMSFGRSFHRAELLDLELDLILEQQSDKSPSLGGKIRPQDVHRLVTVWEELDAAYSRIQWHMLHRLDLRWFRQGMPDFEILLAGVFANALHASDFSFEEYQLVKITSLTALRARGDKSNERVLDDILGAPAIEIYAREVLDLDIDKNVVAEIDEAAVDVLRDFIGNSTFAALRTEQQLSSLVIGRIYRQRSADGTRATRPRF